MRIVMHIVNTLLVIVLWLAGSLAISSVIFAIVPSDYQTIIAGSLAIGFGWFVIFPILSSVWSR